MMSPLRIAALVVGTLLVLPAAGLLIGGGALAAAYAFGRDADGYFEVSIDRLQSDAVAITAEELDLAADPGSPDRALDAVDLDVRLRVTSADSGQEVFVGIAPEPEVDGYLAGVAHDELREFDNGVATYLARSGGRQADPPAEQSFWAVSAVGPGTQEIEWEATQGRWAVVVMNADGSPGVMVDADVGAKAGALGPLMGVLLIIGALLLIGAVGLIAFGAIGDRDPDAEERRLAVPVAPDPGVRAAGRGQAASPVTLEAALAPDLSRWRWLVKWFLAIPHVVVLFFLWIAFAVLTIVAGFAILFSGHYPRRIFDFNVGVLRWSWRVSYYASSGGIGTDRYPPFTLSPVADYPAWLEVSYPGQLSRWLVLVKWWLLALPHYVIVAVLVGGSVGWTTTTGDNFRFDPTGGGGLLGILVVIAGVILLFTGRYPKALFDLVIGLNRWIYRVVAYAALMTDDYPPFRLDQGGAEPTPDHPVDELPRTPSHAAEPPQPVGG